MSTTTTGGATPTFTGRAAATTLADGTIVLQNGRIIPFWYTREGQIIRWSIFFGLFGLLFLYMIIGYWHAKSRIKKGLPPLAYHRWLLNRETRARYDPSYVNPSMYYQQEFQPQYGYYGMNNMAPPMYNPNAPVPPTYQPQGASKIDPSQEYRTAPPTRRPAEGSDGAPSYEAPPGPPPAAANPFK
ncbi:hypothetical protein BP6252_07141 [Coleophoma cylindrospora]|uniref:Uncharacterized protein n=1 Tax=Coleophoma cylindrospora TaxID=1849047 RepID=A0A3D8RH68_9HELO|nr:hypothetical protein BP6252_07141 [Coleophoma cylindrospora]